MSAAHCPHKVPKRSWSFNYSEVVPQDSHYARIFVVTASSCPSCLQDRVTNLRSACERLVGGLKNVMDMTPEQRRRVEIGLKLYYDDRVVAP